MVARSHTHTTLPPNISLGPKLNVNRPPSILSPLPHRGRLSLIMPHLWALHPGPSSPRPHLDPIHPHPSNVDASRQRLHRLLEYAIL